MRQEFETAIASAVHELFAVDSDINLDRPEEQFGDFSTNVALQLSKQLNKNPREIAETIAEKLKQALAEKISEVSVAGPGFINIRLSDSALLKTLDAKPARSLAGQVVVAEYSDPNPFKVLHAGHLYTSLVGDAIARLMEHAGAIVHRVNFGGDVGLHVGKTMWAVLQELGGENVEKLSKLTEHEQLNWLSQRYVEGNTAYDEDESAKQEIIKINKRVYEIHATNDQSSTFAKMYWKCRRWSYDGFGELYKQLQMVPFEKYYPESAVSGRGLEIVKQHTGEVYEESDGAIIFRGEKYDLFTQVFINSEGLPTYAGKDVGLIFQKYDDFKPNKSFIITDVSQKDHLAVIMASIMQFAPDLVKATTHYTHGQIKMAGGVKMSSRLGNILSANDILDAAVTALEETDHGSKDETYLGAVKYAFLKNRIGGDIVYDPKESVSLEGNSGPYLQYAHARAQSILQKADTDSTIAADAELEAGERSLVRKIGESTEVIDRAVAELMPHHICTYLYELAQVFNRFYEKNRVIDDPRQALRLALVQQYAQTLQFGLQLLGIATPDKM